MQDKYIVKKSGKDTYQFNMRVPKALAHLYPHKTFITRTLGTSCIKTARIRRDRILGEIAAQKESTFSNERGAFLAFVETLKEAKQEARGNPYEAYYQLSTQDILDTEAFPNAQLAASRTVTTGIIPEGYRPTLRESLHSWLQRNSRKNADTISKMKSTTDKFLKHCGHFDVELESIHRKDVLDYIEQTIESCSVSTMAANLSRLKTLYKHAWQIGLIEPRPCPFSDHDLAFYKESTTQKTQMFSPEEIQKIMQWADTQTNSMRLIVKTGLFTGMRIGEICALRACDVCIEGNLAAFYVRKGKTGAAQRTVPLCDELMNDIQDLIKTLQPESSLFGIDGKNASRDFSRFKTASITTDKTKRFHSFRVHMATAFSRAGISELTAAFILGHKGGKTMSYGYYAKADELHRLKDAVEAATEVIKRDWLKGIS
ncbi:tyrosine-type recombinase/integrase [Shewanella sp. HN-41]|uniref:tyrosine-type recombinase/integrase n=1 Tax=Shewanella sp. HN-41 TaxID=327275 RepID=UPI0002125A8D|nr:tyrosine-type recombinase/integrase [Shewanella sp. HN-41]EGM68817.1 integrase [Shewanella sp. HN-41]